MAVDVGLDLLPQRAARAASAEPDAGDRDFQLREEREGIAEAHGDALHDCADAVGSSVRCSQLDEGRAGLRIEVRSAFAEEVRRP
jgi:hypothetical protein